MKVCFGVCGAGAFWAAVIIYPECIIDRESPKLANQCPQYHLKLKKSLLNRTKKCDTTV